MSSDSSGADPGTLTVWVPHWAATVRLSDNQYHSIATLSPQSDSGTGPFPVRSTLGPGVYHVHVELGGTADSEWVSVRSKKETEIPAERWATLQLETLAPLETTASGVAPSPMLAASEAEKWSRTLTWTASRPGAARLFIFVQTPDPKKYPDFAQGLTLLDQSGSPLTSLVGECVKVNATAGWLSFSTDLAGGFYILQRQGPGPLRYKQPLYLSDGWETQVFLAGAKGPSFRSLTLHMARHGHGFRRDDEIAAAAEAVLTALRRERAIATVVRSSHLKRLLHAEERNPWLAVLAAYALTIAEEDSLRSNADPSTTFADPALKHDILEFLRQTLGSHPDVRALCLVADAPASEPFPYPPLMRIGLQRVQQHATRFTNTIPLNSLTERMLTRQVTSSLWSIWNEDAPDNHPVAASGVASTVKPKARALGGGIVTSLGASAPVYRATRWSRGRGVATTQLQQTLYDLPLIKAAKQMIGSTQPWTQKIVVNPRAFAGKLLSEIEPQALSAAASIPLDRAQLGLTRLKAKLGGTTPTRTKAGPAEQAILQYALRQGSQTGGPESDATPAQNDSGRSDDSLEETISALRSASAQLSRLSPEIESDPTLAARAKAISDRLTGIANSLLRQADLIVITDLNDQLLYANGAFTLLTTTPDGKDQIEMWRKWAEWLGTVPSGRTTGLTSPADSVNRLWTVRRTAVEDESTGQTVAFVNIIEDEKRVPMSDAAFAELTRTVANITLQASFVQYGSIKKVSAGLEKLEGLSSRLESSIPIPLTATSR